MRQVTVQTTLTDLHIHLHWPFFHFLVLPLLSESLIDRRKWRELDILNPRHLKGIDMDLILPGLELYRFWFFLEMPMEALIPGLATRSSWYCSDLLVYAFELFSSVGGGDQRHFSTGVVKGINAVW